MFPTMLSLSIVFALNFSWISGYYSELYDTITRQESGRNISLANTPSWQKSIAITFDDGPHPVYTREILDILDREWVPATFFVLGSRIRGSEQILSRMEAWGHEIGNHSYIHPQFTKIMTLRYVFEVWRTAGMIWSATGKYPIFFRFPYWAEDRRIGYFHSGPIVGWNVDAYDWKAKDPERLANSIIAQTKSGSIILLHDIKKDTVKTLPLIIDGLKRRGYWFVPLRDLIGYKKEKDYKNIIYRAASISGTVRSRKVIIPTTSSIAKIWALTGSTTLTGDMIKSPNSIPQDTLTEIPPHE